MHVVYVSGLGRSHDSCYFDFIKYNLRVRELFG